MASNHPFKQAYYFPHFNNARNDTKLLSIRRVFGMEGYGIYFAILEMLREQENYSLPLSSIPNIEYELRVSREIVEAIIRNFDLFEIYDNEFFSPKLRQYMEYYQNKSLKAKESINARWQKQLPPKDTNVLIDDTNVLQPLYESDSDVIQRKEKKEKEKKEKEKKGNQNSEEKKEKREFAEIPISEFENIFSPYTQENKYLIFSDIFKKWQIIREKTNWLTKNGTMITDYINDFEHFINLEITFWRQNEHQRKAGVQSRTNGTSKPLTSEEFDKYLAD